MRDLLVECWWLQKDWLDDFSCDPHHWTCSYKCTSQYQEWKLYPQLVKLWLILAWNYSIRCHYLCFRTYRSYMWFLFFVYLWSRYFLGRTDHLIHMWMGRTCQQVLMKQWDHLHIHILHRTLLLHFHHCKVYVHCQVLQMAAN